MYNLDVLAAGGNLTPEMVIEAFKYRTLVSINVTIVVCLVIIVAGIYYIKQN